MIAYGTILALCKMKTKPKLGERAKEVQMTERSTVIISFNTMSSTTPYPLLLSSHLTPSGDNDECSDLDLLFSYPPSG